MVLLNDGDDHEGQPDCELGSFYLFMGLLLGLIACVSC
jgi:hypothetical protein